MDTYSAVPYNNNIERLREQEYPSLNGQIYLDHAGTAPVAKSIITRFSSDVVDNLYGNPHASSASSQLSTRRVQNVRYRVLKWLNLDPADFDLVFVSNATAGIKLVIDCLSACQDGFWYGYHKDSHTSLVGARELAKNGHGCFCSDEDFERCFRDEHSEKRAESQAGIELFAYPAQSNMNGRRLPLSWCKRIRESARQQERRMYSLLDAAALVPTSPVMFSKESAPDFMVFSFSKIFGFPDLGGLVVRKDSSNVLRSRKFFGGGTVEAVTSIGESWHITKETSIHDMLEDGTVPIHNIQALGHAIAVHEEIFVSIMHISQHTAYLANRLYNGLASLRHGNGNSLCHIYRDHNAQYTDLATQGPIVAFNMRNDQGAWISNSEVEKLASVHNIHIRSGTLCNPGGVANSLRLSPSEIQRNFAAGHRCGSENDVIEGKPTGMLRASLGAMSTVSDVDRFIDFCHEFFVTAVDTSSESVSEASSDDGDSFFVETLTIYPIKSCAGWRIPAHRKWLVKDEGLAWDREWCLVNPMTGQTLSQKSCPKMALLRPRIDLSEGLLRVRYAGYDTGRSAPEEIVVPLSLDPNNFQEGDLVTCDSTVCDDTISARIYSAQHIGDFFTRVLGTQCQLARFPASTSSHGAGRHTKEHLTLHPGRPDERSSDVAPVDQIPILLSNESPILTISRSSINRLNEQIKSKGGKATPAESFRANIVVAQDLGTEQPYVEDNWSCMQIGEHYFKMLGPCRRCQMVCIDQETATRSSEPLSTLAKTRRFGGRILFGQHTCHVPALDKKTGSTQTTTIRVGDRIRVW